MMMKSRGRRLSTNTNSNGNSLGLWKVRWWMENIRVGAAERIQMDHFLIDISSVICSLDNQEKQLIKGSWWGTDVYRLHFTNQSVCIRLKGIHFVVIDYTKWEKANFTPHLFLGKLNIFHHMNVSFLILLLQACYKWSGVLQWWKRESLCVDVVMMTRRIKRVEYRNDETM